MSAKPTTPAVVVPQEKEASQPTAPPTGVTRELGQPPPSTAPVNVPPSDAVSSAQPLLAGLLSVPPSRLPEILTPHLVQRDAGEFERGAVGLEQPAVDVEQVLQLKPAVEHGAKPVFALGERPLRPAQPDPYRE